MRIITLALALFFFSSVSYSQTELWHHSDSVHGMLQKMVVDTKGNIHVTAQGYPDTVFLLKFDTAGVRQWVTSRPGSHTDRVLDVLTDTSGNTYFCGLYYGTNFNAFLEKVDTAGNMLWIRNLNYANNYDNFSNLLITHDGNILATGTSIDTSGFQKIVLSKFAPDGTVLWHYHYGVSGYEYNGYTSFEDAAGNIFVQADRQSASTGFDIAAVKFDSAGVFQWEQLVSTPGSHNDGTRSMSVDPNGNIYLAGYTLYNNNRQNTFLAKVNGDGSLGWSKSDTHTTGLSELKAIVLDEYNNVYVAGYDSGAVAYIAKIDTFTANTEWTLHYAKGSINDLKYANGALYATGFINDSTTQEDVFAMKVSTTGQVLWSTRYNGLADTTDVGVNIVVSGHTIYVGANTIDDSIPKLTLFKYQEIINTGIFESKADAPFTVIAYPNPTEKELLFTIDITTTGHAAMHIYDINGKQLATIFNQQMAAGKNTVQWSAEGLAKGTYLYEMVTPAGKSAGKFVKF